jgi:hypothetical protein
VEQEQFLVCWKSELDESVTFQDWIDVLSLSVEQRDLCRKSWLNKTVYGMDV